MTRLRWAVVAGSLVLALVGGGVAWVIWPERQTSWSSACSPALATDEVERFFGTNELSAQGRSEKWDGHKAAECSVRPEKISDSRSLRITSRPGAAYKQRGASEYRLGSPIGFGWTGSVNSSVDYGTTATVLIDCKTLPGSGLLTVAETPADSSELSADKETQLARAATESARQAAKKFKCEGSMGSRVEDLKLEEPRQVGVEKVRGACKGVLSEAVASRLEVTSASESPAAGRTLSEACFLRREVTRYSLSAYYGPQAQYEKFLDGRNGVVPEETLTATKQCGGALGEAYFKLVPKTDAIANEEILKQVLASFSAASVKRNGCSGS